MTKIRKKYSDEDKLHFVRLYQESGMSKNSFCRKYEICNHTLLNTWLRKFEPNQKEVSYTAMGRHINKPLIVSK